MNPTSFSTPSAERISALCDGQLPVDEVAQTVGELLGDTHAKQTWLTYHVVGDVLRSTELAPSARELAFLTRLEQRLATEPTPLRAPVLSESLPPMSRHSANASVFRWKMFAGLACTVLVAVLGWEMLWATPGQGVGQAQMSAAPVPASTQTLREVPVADLGVMVRDPRLDELLDAHRQLGGHSALQMPSGFLRNATYEGAAR